MAKKKIKVVLTNHVFELRNVQVAEFLSEETTAFSADIFVDGQRIGYCTNSGKGEGNFPRVTNEYRPLIEEIEAETTKHFHKCVLNGKTYNFKYTMDFLIGMMVDAAYYENKSVYKL